MYVMYYVYIIYSLKLNRYYVGYTEDLDKRLYQHNKGFSSFTSKANDWQLKFKQPFDTRESAILREKEIKNKKSRKYIEWIISITSSSSKQVTILH
jgi:putative endonuclease